MPRWPGSSNSPFAAWVATQRTGATPRGGGAGEEWRRALKRLPALTASGRQLHTYLRMLGGKAVLMWKQDPADALRVLEDLNNKYALDGRDPNSYGGILWCFGKFDRPFYRRPIYETVRYMSLKAAEKKLDVR